MITKPEENVLNRVPIELKANQTHKMSLQKRFKIEDSIITLINTSKTGKLTIELLNADGHSINMDFEIKVPIIPQVIAFSFYTDEGHLILNDYEFFHLHITSDTDLTTELSFGNNYPKGMVDLCRKKITL